METTVIISTACKIIRIFFDMTYVIKETVTWRRCHEEVVSYHFYCTRRDKTMSAISITCIHLLYSLRVLADKCAGSNESHDIITFILFSALIRHLDFTCSQLLYLKLFPDVCVFVCVLCCITIPSLKWRTITNCRKMGFIFSITQHNTQEWNTVPPMKALSKSL